MHLDDERIQRLVDRELSESAERNARAHLADCADCRRLVSGAEREDTEVRVLLQRLDRPAPATDAGALIDRAAMAPDRWSRDVDAAPRMRWAAGFLVALGIVAAAAYAIPGSPLRAWVGAVQAWVDRGRSSGPSTAPETAMAGIAVTPGEAFVIEFTSPQTQGELTIIPTDDSEIVARTRNGAAAFRSGPDRLVIDNRGSSSTVEIRIPRSAPRVEVRLDETSLYLQDGSRITTTGRADETGVLHIALTSPGR
jgi:hypothetical protein